MWHVLTTSYTPEPTLRTFESRAQTQENDKAHVTVAVLDAKEAYAKGLLTRVVEDSEAEREAYATARRIADGAPLVARWHKQYIRRLAPGAPPLTQAEIDANFDYFNTEDYRIGYDAFMNRKKPRFVDR